MVDVYVNSTLVRYRRSAPSSGDSDAEKDHVFAPDVKNEQSRIVHFQDRPSVAYVFRLQIFYTRMEMCHLYVTHSV